MPPGLLTNSFPLPFDCGCYKAPRGLARSGRISRVSDVSTAGRSLNSSQFALDLCSHPPFSICASFANSLGSFVWFLWLRSSPQRSHARTSRIESSSACALVYAASEASSTVLSVFGDGSAEAGCVRVVRMGWVPDSSRTSEECRSCMRLDIALWKGSLL